MSEVDPGHTGAYRRWVTWVVSGIGVAMSLYHLWIIGGGPAVEHFAQATGYDPRSSFPWIWTGPPSAIIYRAGHLLFAVVLVFLNVDQQPCVRLIGRELRLLLSHHGPSLSYRGFCSPARQPRRSYGSSPSNAQQYPR